LYPCREMVDKVLVLTLVSKCGIGVVDRTLEALAVDDGRTALIVLLLGDPHLLEGREGSQNGTTDPDRVLAFGWSNNLDLHA
jgi:hypothetical protein